MTRLCGPWRTASVWMWVLAGLMAQNMLDILFTRPVWGFPILAWCVAAVVAGLLVSSGHPHAPHVAGATLGLAVVAIVVFTGWVMLRERPTEYQEDWRPVAVMGGLFALGVVITPLVLLGANPYPWRSRPPGWYPNPGSQGAVRWWDGARFTDHTWAGAPAMAPPPLSPPTSSVPQPSSTLETRLRQESERDDAGQDPTDFT